MNKPANIEAIVLVPEPSLEFLTVRKLIAYGSHRREFLKWLTRQGKNPDALERYAHDTAKNYPSTSDKFHRYVWEEYGYTFDINHDSVKDYFRPLVMTDNLQNLKLALLIYFRFAGDKWDPDVAIPSSSGSLQPLNFFSDEERTALPEEALE
jgi:hypothetical protein